MTSSNQIHVNPRFFQNNKAPRILINPECLKIGRGADASKQLNTSSYEPKNIPSVCPVVSLQLQTYRDAINLSSKLNHFSLNHNLAVTKSEILKNNKNKLLKCEANQVNNYGDKNVRVHDNLLQNVNSVYKKVDNFQNQSNVLNYPVSKNKYHSKSPVPKLPSSDLKNKYKLMNSKNMALPSTQENLHKTKSNLVESDGSNTVRHTQSQNKYKYIKSKASLKLSRLEVMTKNISADEKRSLVSSGITSTKKLNNMVSQSKYKFIKSKNLEKSSPPKIMCAQYIGMSSKYKTLGTTPFQSKYRLINSKSNSKSPIKEIKEKGEASLPNSDGNKKHMTLPLHNKYKIVNSKSLQNVTCDVMPVTSKDVFVKVKRSPLKKEGRIISARLVGTHMQANSQYVWNHSNTQSKYAKNKLQWTKQGNSPGFSYKSKWHWSKQAYSAVHLSKSKFPHYTSSKPGNMNPYSLKKTKWLTEEHFPKQLYKTQSLHRLQKNTVKQYINIYKNRSFFSNSSHKRDSTLRNHALTNFRVINIDGKAYHSNSTSLRRRSISNAFNHQPSNRSKIAFSHKFTKENDHNSDKSSLKPGALIEILRQRKMAVRKVRTEICTFYRKNGFCNRHQKKICPFVHKKENARVCTRFLRGDCQVEKCRFSHQLDRSKMPVCSHFVQGACTRPACPYRHVKVNPSAPLCRSFLEGDCTAGDACRKQHVLLCAEYERTAQCPRGAQCPLNHRRRKKRSKNPAAAAASGGNRIKPPSHRARERKQILGGDAVASDGVGIGKDNCPRYFDSVRCDSSAAEPFHAQDSSLAAVQSSPVVGRLKKHTLPNKLPAFIPLFSEDLAS